MTTRRPLLVRVQIIMGLYDADGNLTGVEPGKEQDLYYPWLGSLEKLIDLSERDEAARQEKEHARTHPG